MTKIASTLLHMHGALCDSLFLCCGSAEFAPVHDMPQVLNKRMQYGQCGLKMVTLLADV